MEDAGVGSLVTVAGVVGAAVVEGLELVDNFVVLGEVCAAVGLG